MAKKVLLFLAQGFEEYEASVFTDIMGWSREKGREPVSLMTAGIREKIKGTWNLSVIPQTLIKNINVNDYDALAIPGGFEEAGFYEDAWNPEFLNLIREFHSQNKIIASICVGALALAKAGILKGMKATTYDISEDNNRQEQIRKMGAEIENKRIVVHENIITSTGPATAVDVAFTLLEMLTDKENADIVRYHMRFK